LRVQGEDFDEDEGIYDDLNLDEEEEKFGLAPDDDDSDESDAASEGNHYSVMGGSILLNYCRHTTSNTVQKA
jgi:CCR4-NOT transcriptional regulation complex NOT5 subunit